MIVINCVITKQTTSNSTAAFFDRLVISSPARWGEKSSMVVRIDWFEEVVATHILVDLRPPKSTIAANSRRD